jgi:ribosomal protein S4
MGIKRIKFKPGYMNIWRDARKNILSSLNLSYKYQKKLTTYLSKFHKLVKFKLFLFFELRLLNVLVKSRFLSDLEFSSYLIKNKNIFVNGIICLNPMLQLFVNDFVQMYINIKFYIIFKWIKSWTLKKKIKLKKRTIKKVTFSRSNEEKTKSFTLPNWILSNKNIIEDVSNFIEVDYATLSFFILYEPISWNNFSYYNIIDKKYNIMNLYNWKYIT